jgi:hypothetical protein
MLDARRHWDYAVVRQKVEAKKGIAELQLGRAWRAFQFAHT